MYIEELRIQNYRVFREVTVKKLPAMALFVGANGSGKSTLFDIFGFLRDALKENVHVALAKRGGFKELVSRGQPGPIRLVIRFRDQEKRLVTYDLSVGAKNGHGIVEREILKYRRGRHGQPWNFLDFTNGAGSAITNEFEYGTPDAEMQREDQQLDSPDILAIKGLGQFKRFKVVSAFRSLIESWHLSDFHIQAARPSQEHGYAEHLSRHGENLAQVTQFLFHNHKDLFEKILQRMKERVPGVTQVEAKETVDGRLVLRFKDGAFEDPFIARYVSDGTIKMFAYLVLLHDPAPHPLLCIEEPENQLYPRLLIEIIEEFRSYGSRGGQVLISTHSPELLNRADLSEIYWLEKSAGFTQIKAARNDNLLKNLLAEGDVLGELWQQGLFGKADP